MGGGTFDPGAYRAFTAKTVGKKTEDIYTSRAMSDLLNPFGVKVRESRDSSDNPLSTPVIVSLDVTGSMGMLADIIAREGLGTLFTGILDRKPISNPHVMFMAVGDAHFDRAPLQVSQFEADKRIIEQLAQIYLEGGGGGNNSESYHLPWYFAACHTFHDSIEKRGKRGYLFTVGDEEVPGALTKAQIKKFVGDDVEQDFSAEDLLALVSRKYDVYHVIVEEGHHARHRPREVFNSWTELLGQHVIRLKDHKALAETIVSTIEIAEGGGASASASAWGVRSGTVLDAVKHLSQAGSGRPLLGGPSR